MFGWHPRFSIDASLGTGLSNQDFKLSYAARLQKRMLHAYRAAGEAARMRAGKNKTFYDQKITLLWSEMRISKGDSSLRFSGSATLSMMFYTVWRLARVSGV